MLDNELQNNYHIIINGTDFEWDEVKSDINVFKHRISFYEAATVFCDEDALVYYDPDHSEAEDRYIILGVSNTLNLLVVCHCYRGEDKVRIISARKATKTESGYYERK
jgi:uncharacterized DUF497 family protein